MTTFDKSLSYSVILDMIERDDMYLLRKIYVRMAGHGAGIGIIITTLILSNTRKLRPNTSNILRS